MLEVTAQNVKWLYIPVMRSLALEALTVAAATVDWSYRTLADPRQIKFTSHHTGVVTSWDWDFGDGSLNSTVRNPQHQFEVVGESTEFDVRLTINGSLFEEKTITVFNLTELPGPNDLDAYTLTIDEANNMTVEQATNMTVT
jgi:PKD repeat protein